MSCITILGDILDSIKCKSPALDFGLGACALSAKYGFGSCPICASKAQAAMILASDILKE